MRKDALGNQLLPRMYFKHGAYWHVKRNKWKKLGTRYNDALRKYPDLEQPRSDWGDLLEMVYETFHRRKEKGDLAEGTLKQYDGIRPRLLKGFQDLSVHEIVTRDVTLFLDQYESTPNIANRMLSVLRVVFERGCRVGACDHNPAVGIKRFKEGKRTRYVTDAEYMALRDNANDHTRLIMDVCYLTAQRIGDVLHIKRGDISPEGIEFRQQKSGTRLLVQMTPSLESVIEEAKTLRSVPCSYLFHPKGKGTPYGYSTIKDGFNRAVRDSKVPHCTLHDLRAKALTDVKRAGGDAQALAGHSFEATTKRYIRGLEMPTVCGPSLDNLISIRQSK